MLTVLIVIATAIVPRDSSARYHCSTDYIALYEQTPDTEDIQLSWQCVIGEYVDKQRQKEHSLVCTPWHHQPEISHSSVYFEEKYGV